MSLHVVAVITAKPGSEDAVRDAMAGLVGSFAAMHAIRVLLVGHAALGDPQWGQLHLFDGLAPSLPPLRIANDPTCRTRRGERPPAKRSF